LLDRYPSNGTHPDHSRRIVVIGCGHVGLVMASGFARLGHTVVGVDRSPELIAGLVDGLVPFHEAGLAELVADGQKSGRLAFTSSYRPAAEQADFIFLAVDTPTTPGGAADLRNIRAAAHSIAISVNGSNPVIVNKSTSPIGTGDTIDGILRRNLSDGDKQPRIVSNPEFLRQGHAVQDFFHPDRIVVGSASQDDARAVAELYRELDAPVLITTLRTAEMVKYVANAFLGTRISFINEVARLCEALGVNVDNVVEGISHDARIGRHFFKPGIGFGGSCLPKDIAALRYMGEAFGIATPVLTAVSHVNYTQRTSVVRKLRDAIGHLDGKTIGVWGVTFKGDTEDVRQSPALDVISLLLNEGAVIRAYDPSHPERLPERIAQVLQRDAIEAARGADALAVLTDWEEFRTVPLSQVHAVMRGDVILDGRNLLSFKEVEASGFRYIGVGRPRPARSLVRA
jgi:UDPglucose 6-dehydrogenase